jgi:glucokinase
LLKNLLKGHRLTGEGLNIDCPLARRVASRQCLLLLCKASVRTENLSVEETAGLSNVIGIDLGGTNIFGARIDENGRIQAKRNRNTPVGDGGPAVMSAMVELAAGLRDEESRGVGVISPGIVDARHGSFIGAACNIPGMDEIALAGEMAKALGLPAFAENDGNGAALAENWIGSARGAKVCVMLTLGTGIGGGVVINGKILHGASYCAGELGHLSIDYNGMKCSCGGTGCAEIYASASALIRAGRAALEKLDNEATGQALLQACGSKPETLNAKMICDLARAEDALACKLLANFARPLAATLASVINAFNPDRLVIGGGLSLAWDLLGGLVERELANGRALPTACAACKIVPAALGDEAGVIGAARMAWNHLRATGISARL